MTHGEVSITCSDPPRGPPTLFALLRMIIIFVRGEMLNSGLPSAFSSGPKFPQNINKDTKFYSRYHLHCRIAALPGPGHRSVYLGLIEIGIPPMLVVALFIIQKAWFIKLRVSAS